MPTIKPAPGMTYDFEVLDFFYLSSGTLAFAGYPSVDYELFIPATANVIVNNQIVGTVKITMQPHFKRLVHEVPEKIALETRDKIDLAPFKGQKIILRCTLISPESAQ